MIEGRYHGEVDRERAQRRLYEKICIALFAVIFLLGLCLLTTDREERTLFVPPQIHKPFWIKGDELSREYLEIMGEWLVGLPLSVTPASVDSRSELFLRYVAPAAHAGIKAKFDLQAERIRKENISTLFFPVAFQTHSASRQVAITGDFITVISGVPAPAVRRTWRLRFTPINGTYWITEFIEVKGDKAFEQSTAGAEPVSE